MEVGMVLDDYRVRLEAFEGPLDLLLFLIRRNEVDIHDIPISPIASQYMAYLAEVESNARIDIDTAGEFLVMAATLMEIKSRMLLPQEQRAESEAAPTSKEDPRAELVKQLLAYKQFRDAADSLEKRAEDWGRRVGTAPVDVAISSDAATNRLAGLSFSARELEKMSDDPRLAEALAAAEAEATDVEDLELIDLVEAFKKITETVNFERLGEHQVTYDDTPVELHAEDLLDRLRRDAVGAPGTSGELTFASIFEGRTRGEAVGLFLAMLHLVARRQVAVRQDATDGSIYLKARDPEPTPDASTAAARDLSPLVSAESQVSTESQPQA